MAGREDANRTKLAYGLVRLYVLRLQILVSQSVS